MTFKQLLDKYTFEDIIPELNELWNKGNLYLFRQALSILKSLEPTADTGVIDVHHIESDFESYNRVNNMSGYLWHDNLSWEIRVDPKCNLSEKQLLALCLWERTFYGFSPKQQEATFEQWSKESDSETLIVPNNPYYRQLIDRKRSNYRKFVKPNSRRYDELGFPIWPTDRIVGGIKKRGISRFRKAQQRYHQCCERLERLSEQAELIKDIKHKYQSTIDSDLQFLLTEKTVNSYTFIGVTSTPVTPINYIIESILYYSNPITPTSITQCLALLCFSDGSEPNQSELGLLLKAIQTKVGVEPKLIHTRNVKDGDPMRFTIMYI